MDARDRRRLRALHRAVHGRRRSKIGCKRLTVRERRARRDAARRAARSGSRARVGARHAEPVGRVRRAAVRRTARRRADLDQPARLLRDPARNLLLRPPRLARRRGARDRAGLRRPALLAARVLRVEAAAAVRATGQCARGRAGKPPTCGSCVTLRRRATRPRTTWRRSRVREPRRALGRALRDRPHAPDDSETDLYPVALERAVAAAGHGLRRSVRPRDDGLEVVRAGPRSRNAYGMLMAAEAQPDGTIGRRRFLAGLVLVRSEHQGRRRRLQAIPSADVRRARATRSARSTTPRSPQAPRLRALQPQQYEGTQGRLLRAHGSADQSGAARRRTCALQELDRRAGRIGAQRACCRSTTASSTGPKAPTARSRCRSATRSSRPKARGKTSPRRRATCGC